MSRERKSFDLYPGFKILEAAYQEVQTCGKLSRRQLISLLNQSCKDLGPYKESAIDFLYDLSIFDTDNSFIICSECNLDFESQLLESALSKIEEMYGEVVCREYDSGEYYIDKGTFNTCPALRNLLIDLNYLGLSKNDRLYLLVKPKEVTKHLRKITPDDLKKIQKNQETAGNQAELYVMEYEKKRLANTPGSGAIERISLTDVTAGFDILSFDTGYEQIPNRMIEVKGYSKQIGFFWSHNEREKAKQYRFSYHLYLVDLSKKDKPGYQPIIIDNPLEKLSEDSQWSEEIDTVHMIYQPR